MLSYRHAFHAGNHADVLKHAVLLAVLDHLGRKDKPLTLVDTHAGAGRYALDSAHADKTGEWRDGAARLFGRDGLPALLDRYCRAIAGFNRGGPLRFYPGSPLLMHGALRADDRLRLFELHPTDFGFLEKAFAAGDRRVVLAREDGFRGLRALLPPPSRRALVMIDPAYERREDYAAVVDTLHDALRRFAGGCYMVWYPRLQKAESKLLAGRLIELAPPSWLHVWLDVARPSPDGFGMHGSGLVLFNPPWTLPRDLAEAMPVLVDRLGRDGHARFGLDSHMP
ncbi:MAG: 23S rRNA (adenine(2030)-N(6))-methyltransferase RlmJ [Rhodocyclaceae bacterium]|nr:23S rRNA (adenine(2030)-N(6))-methyltransferase RlmJ [Rhodocyclaceae bacterium]